MANGKSKKTAETALEEGEHWLERFTRDNAIAAGRPAAFIAACILIILWAAAGPFFGFSESWALVVNTGTTIITFLMVFLIQRAQNRDTLAVQAKLAELIIAVKGADNKVALAEQFSQSELEALREEHTEKAEEALDELERDVAAPKKKAGSQTA